MITIEQIQNNFTEAIQYGDASLAIKLLTEIRKNYSDNSELAALVPKLQFIRMMSLTPSQFLSLLEKSLPEAYSIQDFDLAEKIKQYTSQIELIPEQINFLKNLRVLLKKDDAMLGGSQIKVGPQLVEPTVGNWIYDYEQTPAKNPVRTEFDELSYINGSQNVRILSEAEAKILLNILKIYDFVNNIVNEWDATPEYNDPAQIPGKFDLYDFIPGLITEQEVAQYNIESLQGQESAQSSERTQSIDRPASQAESLPNRPPASLDAAVREPVPSQVAPSLVDKPISEPEPINQQPADVFAKSRDAGNGLIYQTSAKKPREEYGLNQSNTQQSTPKPERNAVVPIAPENKLIQDMGKVLSGRNYKRGIVLDRSSNVQVEELSDNLAKQKEATNERIKQKLEDLRQRKG